MPRTDREDSRRSLRMELTGCGFSASDAEGWVTMFSDEHLTSADVGNIRMMLFEVHMIYDAQTKKLEEERKKFEEERKKFENDLQCEKELRQGFLDHIKEFVSESIKGLNNFAELAETAHDWDFRVSPKVIANFRAFCAKQRDSS